MTPLSELKTWAVSLCGQRPDLHTAPSCNQRPPHATAHGLSDWRRVTRWLQLSVRQTAAILSEHTLHNTHHHNYSWASLNVFHQLVATIISSSTDTTRLWLINMGHSSIHCFLPSIQSVKTPKATAVPFVFGESNCPWASEFLSFHQICHFPEDKCLFISAARSQQTQRDSPKRAWIDGKLEHEFIRGVMRGLGGFGAAADVWHLWVEVGGLWVKLLLLCIPPPLEWQVEEEGMWGR